MQRMMLRGRGGGEEERFQVESGLRVFPVALAFDVLDSASVTVEAGGISINQSISQSINQSFNQSINQSINHQSIEHGPYKKYKFA